MSEHESQSGESRSASPPADQHGDAAPREDRSRGEDMRDNFRAIKDEMAGAPQALDERAQEAVNEHPMLGEMLDFRLLGIAAVVALLVGLLFSLLSHVLGLLLFFVLFFGLWLGVAARRARN